HYGARGIYVCDEWYTPGVPGNPGLVNFYNWAIANGYEFIRGKGGRNKLSIDRIDGNGPYAPWNCRFVDYYVQENNRSNTSYIEDIDGEVLPVMVFERKHGLPRQYVHKHRHKGYVNPWSTAAINFAARHQDWDITTNYVNRGYATRDGFTVLVPSMELQKKLYGGGQKDGSEV
ncbi:MAG: hypothetical protein K2F99_00390, partial [Muribaculaceae bacterium]|nr:hypothetical protein [Muribaculaceae bacterium]